jgi:hypothetical protein
MFFLLVVVTLTTLLLSSSSITLSLIIPKYEQSFLSCLLDKGELFQFPSFTKYGSLTKGKSPILERLPHEFYLVLWPMIGDDLF